MATIAHKAGQEITQERITFFPLTGQYY